MSQAITLDHHDHQNHADSVDFFGFWLYILTDCILFASLFAAYLVLHQPGAYGPSLKSFISLPYVLKETLFLLASNFTFGMAILALYKERTGLIQLFLMMTFVLGGCFVAMEVHEFIQLAHEGYSWHTSGGASAFFTLVGTHGFHVSIGLLWILIMMVQFRCFKVSAMTKRRMTYLGLFWNFLDIVWIFVFTIVYLMGAI